MNIQQRLLPSKRKAFYMIRRSLDSKYAAVHNTLWKQIEILHEKNLFYAQRLVVLETIDAVYASILHWRENERRVLNGMNGREAIYGSRNCPLCAKFQPNSHGIHTPCAGCPIHSRTNKLYCENTPYDEFGEADGAIEALIAIRKEISFLEDILSSELDAIIPTFQVIERRKLKIPISHHFHDRVFFYETTKKTVSVQLNSDDLRG